MNGKGSLRLGAQLLLLTAMVVGGYLALERTGASQAAIPSTGDFSGRVSIDGGRRMFLECRGTGRPTVILISGLRGRGDNWSFSGGGATSWPVFTQLAGSTRVCEYDRPGTIQSLEEVSRSDPVPQPRSTGNAVDELHSLLYAAGVQGPYVFAGSSTGGLIGRLYASRYPGEVAGLVMVDAISEAFAKAMGRKAFAIYNRRFLAVRTAAIAAAYPDLETIDFRRSFTEMISAGVRPPSGIPYVVISKRRRFGMPANVPRGFSRVVERAWLAGQNYLTRLAPNALHLVADHAGHRIMIEEPDLVAGQILAVVGDARTP